LEKSQTNGQRTLRKLQKNASTQSQKNVTRFCPSTITLRKKEKITQLGKKKGHRTENPINSDQA
jgi:hypothetical protein